jgi:hypothetical protein
MKKLSILLIVVVLFQIFSVVSTARADELTVNPSVAPDSFVPQESRPVYAGSDVLVLQDSYTWGMEQLYNAPDAAACSDLGISYDVITSTIFKNTPLSDLLSYKAIVLMADQPQSFYQNLYSCKQKIEDYVDSGGVLSAVVYAGWIGYVVTEQFLPGGVTLNFEYCDDVNFDPTHFILSNPDRPVSLDGPWGYNTIIDNIHMASSFYFTSLPSGSKIIAEDVHGHDVFVEYSYGNGKVLAVGIPIQWFYRYKLGLGGTGCQPPWDGANNLKLLYNELLYQSGLITIKDRLYSAMAKLMDTVYSDMEFLAKLEAEMNAIAYLNLQFDTVRFIAKVIVDLASAVSIGSPPAEVADLKSLQYLNTLSTILQGPQYGIKGADIGLCLEAADNYIKNQGLATQSEIEDAYYDYILGTASGQVVGGEKKMPFVQGSEVFNGLQEVLNDIESDYSSFESTLDSITIPETESTVELIQYLNNLDNTLSGIVSASSMVNHIRVSNDREFFYDNELGYLLNLKKQQEQLVERKDQAQLISDACLITKGAAVVAKIVNILALGALTPIQIGVTLTAVSASVVSTVSSSVELTAKTLIFGNKLQSLIQMGSEISNLKQILDDTESYVLWRMTHISSEANGQIMDFTVPDVITDGMSGSQTGSITIKNTGSSPVWATAHIHILGPVSSGGNKMMVYFTAVPSEGVEVGTGLEETITFDYSVLDLGHIQGCNLYEARAYVSLEGKIVGPVVRFFEAGLACEYSLSDVLSGDISASETKSTYVAMNENSVESEFELWYSGSDLDLHLYDQMGNHVGIDYNTMQVQVEIPGATYSGPSANPEWIRLPVIGGSVFNVAVVAVSVFGSESYTVTLAEFPNYHSVALVLDPTYTEVTSGEETGFEITVQNRGNVHDAFELSLTGLNEEWAIFSESLISLDPNNMATVTLTIHPPETGIIPGEYPFAVVAICIADPAIYDSANAIINVKIAWDFVYEDTYGRGTLLKINIAQKLFQFITPDKDYGIRTATYMRQCGRAIIISHWDTELKLITIAVDTKLDFCYAIAWDIQTCKRFILIDKIGIE